MRKKVYWAVFPADDDGLTNTQLKWHIDVHNPTKDKASPIKKFL